MQFEVVTANKDSTGITEPVGAAENFIFGFVGPVRSASLEIQGVEIAVCAPDINGGVYDERRGFDTVTRFECPEGFSSLEVECEEVTRIIADQDLASRNRWRGFNGDAGLITPAELELVGQPAGCNTGQGRIAAEHRPAGQRGTNQ